ncbi:MAG TPA: AIR synthase-related protein, partial [Thermoleophilia bacterium]|nr:AIR synthase-related protein [Thermoleophilia bacterium]
NAAASRAMLRVGVHAATDVTGFGLAGHLAEMLDASGAAAIVWLEAVPLHEGILDLIARGVYAGGLRNNRDYLVERLGDVDRDDPRVLALFDPQTSGGLLMAVSADRHANLLAELEGTGCAAWTVGEVTGAATGTIALHGGSE